MTNFLLHGPFERWLIYHAVHMNMFCFIEYVVSVVCYLNQIYKVRSKLSITELPYRLKYNNIEYLTVHCMLNYSSLISKNKFLF